MSLKKRLAAAFVAAGLIFAPALSSNVAQAKPIVAEAQDRQPTKKAADWLAGQFDHEEFGMSVNGSPGLTADSVLGLIASGSNSGVVKEGVTYLESEAADYAKSPGAAGKLALIAGAVGEDATNFGGVNLVEIMTSAPEGYAFGAALVVGGLVAIGNEVPVDTLNVLLDSQTDNGCFGGFEWEGWNNDYDSTGLAILALQAYQASNGRVDVTENINAGANCLVENSVDGKYWPAWSPANTSGYAIPALSAADVDVTDEAAWLAGQQRPSGALPSALDGDDDNVMATAQGLSGLANVSIMNMNFVDDGSAPTTAALREWLDDAFFMVISPADCEANAIKVVPVEANDAAAKVGPDYDAVQLYDITLVRAVNGDTFPIENYRPAEGMTLKIKVPEGFDDKTMKFALIEGGEVTVIDAIAGEDGMVVDEDGMATFKVPHFSVYGFIMRSVSKVQPKIPAKTPTETPAKTLVKTPAKTKVLPATGN